MQALHDIVKDGHARYIGMSSCWAWQFQLMQRKPCPSDQAVMQLIVQNMLFRID
jgi:aryl-alcohol dehydrogenase-like predicted oxidoreductase